MADHATIRDRMIAAEAWPEGTTSDEKRLRRLLAVAHGLTYGDDGELQSNEPSPFIDFKRDSLDEIERKITQRAWAKLSRDPFAVFNAGEDMTHKEHGYTATDAGGGFLDSEGKPWGHEYAFKQAFGGHLTFTANGDEPLLVIAKDGFYVRGVKVEQGPGEAQAVYEAVLALCGMKPHST